MPTRLPPSGPPGLDVWTRGPPADETCVVSRVVRRGALTLTVWTCKAPSESWARDWFLPRRFPPYVVDRYWPGASSAYWDGPGMGGLVRFVVYDGGPRRRRRAAQYEVHAWYTWRERCVGERVEAHRRGESLRVWLRETRWRTRHWRKRRRRRGGRGDG